MGFQTGILQSLTFLRTNPLLLQYELVTEVDKQVRTKTPGSRIGKWSPVPLGCPSDRYYLGTTLLNKQHFSNLTLNVRTNS